MLVPWARGGVRGNRLATVRGVGLPKMDSLRFFCPTGEPNMKGKEKREKTETATAPQWARGGGRPDADSSACDMTPSSLPIPVILLLLLPISSSLDAVTLRPRAWGGGTGAHAFVDASGRERLFHGTNSITKGPPWIADSQSFSTDISMAKEDFEWMQRLGLNVLRLGLMWPGVEPVRGQYNETYLDKVDAIVTLAAAHGVYTLLDLHQDGLSELFCGEGLPTWAVKSIDRGGYFKTKTFPQPFDKFGPNDYYNESLLAGSPRLPTRQACATKKHGPGHSETTYACSNAFEALYKNKDGILDAWGAMWAKIASRFKGRPEILGLELINEPFAGDLYNNPIIMVPSPSPWNADRQNLQPAYDVVATAVRGVDENVLIFFAGVTWGDLGAGFTAAPGGQEYSNRSVLAYHYYRPPQKYVSLQFEAQGRVARRLATAAFLTETSEPGPGQTGFDEPGGIGDGADAALQSWAGFEWKSFCREASGSNETTAPQSQFGEYGSCKTGYSRNWPARTGPSEAFKLAVARTYARATAGEITAMHFNVSTAAFDLKYVVTAESLKGKDGLQTDIFFYPQHYPRGAVLSASASDGQEVNITFDGTTSIKVSTGGNTRAGTRIHVQVRRKN